MARRHAGTGGRKDGTRTGTREQGSAGHVGDNCDKVSWPRAEEMYKSRLRMWVIWGSTSDAFQEFTLNLVGKEATGGL